MPKTIRELAAELGVSKQRIQQIITKLSPSKIPNKEGNRYVLNHTDVHNIKVLMGLENDKSSTTETTNRFVNYDVYLDVIDSIKEKDEQIKSLLEVQKQTQNLLDQQQRLALQDKKLLEEYKAEIKDLKSLSMPTKDIEKEDSVQKENTIENIKEMPQKQNKKWWHFGRRM
ncbi:MAG: MarR family transcriptional regulator [Liquorilactobacillus hordei]|uniref:MarR family transcriptional regulator n=1 Tax=Liquorilactobacillus hordei TaxID=468911 RepID=UPI0039EAE55F